MMYRLIVLTGPAKGQRITIGKEPVTFGRDPDCSVCLADEEVAKRHAVMEWTPDGLFIRDLGSMNRILVNKREIRQQRLKHGDHVELGLTSFLVQALVQADVSGANGERAWERRRIRRRTLISTTVLLLVLGSGVAYFRAEQLYQEARMAEPAPVAQVPEALPPETLQAMEDAHARVPENSPTGTLAGAMAMSDDLREMKKELNGIRHNVREIVQQREQKPLPAAAPLSPTPRGNELQIRAATMMTEARQELARRNYLKADQLLAGIQVIAPDSLESYKERARLFELRGQVEAAMDQWAQVMRRSAGSEAYVEAVAERIRLGQSERLAAVVRHIRISSISQDKFQAGDTFDEMRILNIALAPDLADQALDSSAVEIQVSFYDEDLKSRRVDPSRAMPALASLRPDPPWLPGEQKMINATYVVPKGLREREARDGRKSIFYGYIVRVFYRGQLQDEEARPKTLLQRATAPAMAKQSGSGTN